MSKKPVVRAVPLTTKDDEDQFSTKDLRILQKLWRFADFLATLRTAMIRKN